MMPNLNQLALLRVPPAPALQAYNAADQLILDRLAANSMPGGRWLLVNDAFGALATALSNPEIDWWNDSAMALEALGRNTAENGAPMPRVIGSAGELAPQYSQIMVLAPKSLALFDAQLSQVSKRLASGAECWVAGMVKHLSRGHQKVMQKHFRHINPGLAVKKARCVILSDPIPNEAVIGATEYVCSGISLVNFPGSFSESRPDPGAKAFLMEFDRLPAVDHFIDLGCGNGILALSYLHRHPAAKAILIDESRQAVASAAASAERNERHAQIHHANGIGGLGLSQVPLILCNPPFHQSTTLTTDIAVSLFEQSARALATDGEFWVVGNRHLDYHKVLGRWFKQVEAVSRHPKFVVFRCTGPKS